MERHAVGDVNGDGRPDLVIVDNLKWDLRWFENPGPDRLTQAWPRHRVCEPGGLPGAYDVDLADVDGDGDLDIAASSWRFGQRFDWYENLGRPGRGTEWTRHEIAGDAQETRAVVFADFNRDGRPDLLGTSRTGNKVLWFANPRDPVADRWHPQLIDSETIAPAHAHAVDLDRDGDLDVLLAAGIAAAVGNDSPQSHRIAWYENLGQPGLGTQWQRRDIAAAFPQGFEAVAGDLDGDGDLDVAATGWSPQGRLAWFENPGNPRQPWNRHDLKTPWSNAVTLVLADIDGDQRPDILACAERGANELRLWRNLGPSTPKPANR
ncbi:MAG: FG-GAP repeat domain-containing protein [Planctomycetaceae bacterium]